MIEMEPKLAEYQEALWNLLRSAKRFRNQIGAFRDADIGDEIWESVNAGSPLVSALGYAEDANDILIRVLWDLGAVRREKLHSQDRKLDKELEKLGVNVKLWVMNASDRDNSPVSHITVAYTVESGLTTEQVTDRMVTAFDRTSLNVTDGIIHASDLKFYLEDEGLYGIALQDVRDERFDNLMAGVISKGRLVVHLRKEAGLPRREPKEKKKKSVEQ